eukprot:SM000002S05492  [mRNA]  locus=s2:56884:58965:- [translate_table: standard]
MSEGAARLPAFHTCVGVGGERLLPKWYKDHGIELLLSTKVISADVKQKTLTTQDEETISYQTLIIATGARALKLEEFGVTGSSATNICYLRDINDAVRLVETMASCKGGNAVVIGGGYIGMECTAALVTNNISVTMVFPESHVMARLFTPQMAQVYEDHYKSRGVKFVKGTVMAAFEKSPSGKVAAVLLKDGTRLAADMVLVGVGIRANTSLFEGQLAIEKGGIKVNGKMRKSVSSVYAIGDVAAFPLKLYGDVRRLEHVDHARKSAAHAVQVILNQEKCQDYDYLPYFYSRVFNLSWQFYGDNVGECFLFGNPDRGKFGAYWVDKGRLTGAFLEGGSQEDYAMLAEVARLRPTVEQPSALPGLGLSFARNVLNPAPSSQGGGGTAHEGGSTALIQLSESSTLMLQACAGVSLAVAIAALAYWYGRRRRLL